MNERSTRDPRQPRPTFTPALAGSNVRQATRVDRQREAPTTPRSFLRVIVEASSWHTKEIRVMIRRCVRERNGVLRVWNSSGQQGM